MENGDYLILPCHPIFTRLDQGQTRGERKGTATDVFTFINSKLNFKILEVTINFKYRREN